MTQTKSRLWLTTLATTIAISALCVGVLGVLRSDLFVLRVIEVRGLPDRSPISKANLLKLSQLKEDKMSLFEVNLPGLRERLLAEKWVDSVLLERKFPHTISIHVQLRNPVALEQNSHGGLRYLDSEANSFAPYDPSLGYVLPVLTGIPYEKLPQALQFLKTWDQHKVVLQAAISQMTWDREHGFRTLVKASMTAGPQRSWLELGDISLEEDNRILLDRLYDVLTYLDQHQYRARNIFADLDKKMVVRLDADQ